MATYVEPQRPKPYGAILLDEPDVDTAPPRATIAEPSMWPQNIRAGGTLRCVAVVEAGSGPVDILRWLIDGSLVVENDASDTDHTFRDVPAGEHLIVLECEGPGGIGRSTRRRALVVEGVQQPPTPDPKPPDPKPPTARTTLRGAHGLYVCAELGGGAQVVANRESAGEWETFAIERVGADAIGLRAADGSYLSVQPNGAITADRSALGAWELFAVERLGEGYALLGAHRRYLSAQPDGSLVADRESAGEWETFISSAPLIPGGGGAGSTLRGAVRIDGLCLVDDNGPNWALGFTDFQAIRNYQFARPFFEQRLDQMAGHGFDFGRFLGCVAWDGLEIDPREPWYREALIGVLKAYDARKMRVQPTVTADLGTARFRGFDAFAFVRWFAETVAPFRHVLVIPEVNNEFFNAWEGGSNWPYSLDQLRVAGGVLRSVLSLPVILSAIRPVEKEGDEERWMAEMASGGFVPSVHLERNTSTAEGQYRPPRQARGPQLSDLAWADTEHIGPGSSGTSENDPRFLLAARIASLMCGAVQTVLHSRAGIGLRQGGGPFKERIPDDAAAACAKVRRYLPSDLHRWRFANHTDSAHPIRFEDGVMITDGKKSMSMRGMVRAFARLAADGRFIVHGLGCVNGSTGALRGRGYRLRIVQPDSGEERTLQLAAGQPFDLAPSVNYLFFGEPA